MNYFLNFSEIFHFFLLMMEIFLFFFSNFIHKHISSSSIVLFLWHLLFIPLRNESFLIFNFVISLIVMEKIHNNQEWNIFPFCLWIWLVIYIIFIFFDSIFNGSIVHLFSYKIIQFIQPKRFIDNLWIKPFFIIITKIINKISLNNIF